MRLFTPVAIVISVGLLVGLYFFVTFEQTAITTLPPQETVQAFTPATPTPTFTPPPTATPGISSATGTEIFLVSASMIPHPIEGQEECRTCHGPQGPLPYPANHQNFDLSMCQVCHATDKGQTLPPPPIKHSLVEREQCTECHALDLQPESHRALDFNDRTCLVCHIIEE
jgi:hypothetical protein